MDKTLLAVVFVVTGSVAVAVTAWVVSLYRQRKVLEQAEQWLPVEARIESGALEGTRESGKMILPTFAFSYQVSGEYYAGRFSLMPDLFTPKQII
jgi:heme exporter protein D